MMRSLHCTSWVRMVSSSSVSSLVDVTSSGCFGLEFESLIRNSLKAIGMVVLVRLGSHSIRATMASLGQSAVVFLEAFKMFHC